ncbi:MAG: alpha/beta hydrolase [bacterium]
MSILRKNKFLFLYIFIFAVAFIIACTNMVFAGKKSNEPVEIKFIAKDGFNLAGILDIPQKASVKNKAPLVIFIHSIGRDKTSWKDYTYKVKNLDMATLNLDLRGHGQSIKDKNGKSKYWQNFKDEEFGKYPDDLISAINYLKKEYPEVNTNKIAIIATSIGVNAAIIAGSKDKNNIKTLVLLSPVSKYKGIDSRTQLVEYGNHPVLMMVSEKDKFAYSSSLDLIRYAQGKKVLKVFPYGGHGTDLLKFQPESQQIIIDWLKSNFLS